MVQSAVRSFTTCVAAAVSRPGSPSVATRGSLVHEVFAEFARRHPQDLPPDPAERLLNLAVNAFAEIEAELEAEERAERLGDEARRAQQGK